MRKMACAWNWNITIVQEKMNENGTIVKMGGKLEGI